MRRWTVGIVLFAFIAIGGWYYWRYAYTSSIVSPLGIMREKPLEKYTVTNLGKRTYAGSQIVLDEATATGSGYTVHSFHYMSDGPTSSRDAGLRGTGKKVTGVAHIPIAVSSRKMPVIIQFRGYADKEQYYPGQGTEHSAQVFAQNGFISLAPDFLGYGGSDKPSSDAFEDRFLTYTTALNLLASVKTLAIADADRVGIWGHSNGGQIALTVLEASGLVYPTSLWAPVSKPFPYSILYYTDEASDRGKLLRKKLAAFEQDYDVELYSLPNYLQRIQAPIQIHQGEADEAVPVAWSDQLVALLKEKGKSVAYFTYPGADHNMVGSWNSVVARDVSFYTKHLK